MNAFSSKMTPRRTKWLCWLMVELALARLYSCQTPFCHFLGNENQSRATYNVKRSISNGNDIENDYLDRFRYRSFFCFLYVLMTFLLFLQDPIKLWKKYLSSIFSVTFKCRIPERLAKYQQQPQKTIEANWTIFSRNKKLFETDQFLFVFALLSCSIGRCRWNGWVALLWPTEVNFWSATTPRRRCSTWGGGGRGGEGVR